MEFKDYYQTMGVSKSATPDEIKRAHRKLARKYHPDVSKEKDAEARFKELAEAYDVLKDPDKRASYDQLGANYKAGQDFQPPPDWAGQSQQRSHGFDQGGDEDHSAFFDSLFSRMGQGRGAGPGGAQRTHQAFDMHGQDQHAKIQVEIEDSYLGANRTLQLRVQAEGSDGRPTTQDRTIEFVIPKGIRAGQHIRLAAQGSPGIGQGSPGDLYLDVEMQPHPLYRTDKYDVLMDLPITPWEAAMGADIEVPTPGGRVVMTIPAGSITGRKLRLKGRGLPAKTPGDFYYVLHVTQPPADTEAGKKLYETMATTFADFKPRGALESIDAFKKTREHAR